jgi:hypothetical protein
MRTGTVAAGADLEKDGMAGNENNKIVQKRRAPRVLETMAGRS